MKCTFDRFLILFGLLCLSACNNPQPDAEIILQKAELLIEEHPDSAMVLIESIIYPEKSLKRENYMRYLVRHVQARYKAHQPIAEDTLIFKARDYFTKKDRDPYITSLSYYYSGCVDREKKEFEDAMVQYVEAERFALLTNDVNLRGLIQYNMGDLLASQGNYLNALDHYRNAESLYSKLPEELYEKVATSLRAIGRMYSLLGDKDNSFKYFLEGLEIAITYDDMSLQNQLAQNISVAYREDRQYDKAELYLRQSFKLNTDSAEMPRYYLNFAKLYDKTGQSDSLNLYVNKLYKSVNPNDVNTFNLSVYEFLTSIEKEKGNYELAFDHNKKHIKMLSEITNERNKQSVFDIQQKYKYQILRNQHKEQLTSFQSWIIILLFIVLISGTSFSWYTIKQRTKYLKTQQQIDYVRDIAKELNLSQKAKISEKEQSLRELLLWKFDVMKKSVLLDQFSTSKMSASEMVKLFHKIVYKGSKNDRWQNILSVFNEVNEGVYDKIIFLFPNLTDIEHKIAVLTYAGMTAKDISIILNLSPNTVQKYRINLRRKLKIDDQSIDTTSFLKEILQE